MPFTWSGKEFNTIEHAFQSAKISLGDPVKALDFTLNSGSVLGQSDGVAAQKKRRMVTLTSEQLLAWNKISKEVMKSIATEKYLQNPLSDSSAILKLTDDAELWHLVTQRGKQSSFDHFEHLEDIREKLKMGIVHTPTDFDHFKQIRFENQV